MKWTITTVFKYANDKIYTISDCIAIYFCYNIEIFLQFLK